MFGLNGFEIPLIVLLALLFFGGKKLPELAQGLGKSMRIIKEEVTKEDEDEVKATETTPATSKTSVKASVKQTSSKKKS